MQWRHTVWPDAKLVYTAIAKVANTSIKSSLLATFMPHISRRNPHSQEIPYLEVEPDSIALDYADHIHFAVVRNPYDRFVSFYEDKIMGTGYYAKLGKLGFSREMPFKEAAAVARDIPDALADPHMRSQSFLLLGDDGQIRPDILLRFERLVQDWKLLSSLVLSNSGVQLPELPHRRVSDRHRGLADYIHGDAQKALAERFAMDFSILNYNDEDMPTRSSHNTAQQLESALAAGARSILDLTVAPQERHSLVERYGGVILSMIEQSRDGQLVRQTSLRDGKISESLFDVLIVEKSDSQHLESTQRLQHRFETTNRIVIFDD